METPNVSSRASGLVIAISLTLIACGGKPGGAVSKDGKSDNAQRTGNPRVVACTLMPKEEMNALTGASYTTTESNDDGHSSESSCHYFTTSDPAGMSLSIDWVNPSDYSDPAEHAALQEASMGGAKLGGKLTAGMPGIPGVPNGPIEGVGEEATVNMMLLTARKGDYTVMVQIIPTDMMTLMTDTTAANAFVEKEKAVARKVLTKL
ncbi:MAG: hypothetical protein ABI311_15085 [Gemmatimonadaceae bacterium]